MTTDLPLFVYGAIFPAALDLLPPAMDTPAARAMLLAIGFQESGFDERLQDGGPARSFWQFERTGVRGVLTHARSTALVKEVCTLLRYNPHVDECYSAIADNDILACVFARLLLWTDMHRLPARTEAPMGWGIYKNTWRPGKPRPQTWDTHFSAAWAIVEPDLE